jgi:hypothetical protein
MYLGHGSDMGTNVPRENRRRISGVPTKCQRDVGEESAEGQRLCIVNVSEMLREIF